MIAALDDSLAEVGRTITLRRWTSTSRGTGAPRVEATVKCSIRRAAPNELLGGINQVQDIITISPTGIEEFFPLVKGDKAVVDLKERNVEFEPRNFVIADVLVRVELVTLG